MATLADRQAQADRAAVADTMVRPLTGAKDVVEGNVQNFGVKGTTLNSPTRKSTRSNVPVYYARYENQLAGTTLAPDGPVPTDAPAGQLSRQRTLDIADRPVVSAWSNGKHAHRFHNDSFSLNAAGGLGPPENYTRLGKQMLPERSKSNVMSPDAPEAPLWTRRKKVTEFGAHTKQQLTLQ
jgi:hypothetical protein